MPRNPVIAAWIAGGLIWGAALLGLGALGGPTTLAEIPQVTRSMPVPSPSAVADAYERALDGDAWGDADRPYTAIYRPAAPDS